MTTPESTYRLVEELCEQLGEGAVSTDEESLAPYAEDYTEIEPRRPDAIVHITTVEQVAPILRRAQELRVPLIPALARSNVGGLCIPTHGGIVLDLLGLDRIHEVHEADRYMVLEPGVTWAQVKEHLDRHHPDLRFGYSLAPPDTSVLANCLMDGLTNLSLRWGGMGDWINGLEVILPTGELVRTGAWAWGQPPVSGSPLPRVEGLVVGWHGTTGVVVKGAVEVQAGRAHRQRSFYFGRDLAQSFRFVNALARSDLCDDVAGLTWPLGKLLFGVPAPTWRDPAEPVVFIFVDHADDDVGVFRARGRAIEALAREFRTAQEPLEGPVTIEELLQLEPRFDRFADWPMRLDFLVDHPGGGLTWIGTYGPTSRWAEAVPACHDRMLQRGYPPSVVTRPMRGGHYGVLRMVTLFDRRNREQIEAVRQLNAEIADLAWTFGFIPYKTPRWIVERYREHLDPGLVRLLCSLKEHLDPAGVLNPGRWLF